MAGLDVMPEIPSEIMELRFPLLIIPLEIESSHIDWPILFIFCISEFNYNSSEFSIFITFFNLLVYFSSVRNLAFKNSSTKFSTIL